MFLSSILLAPLFIAAGPPDSDKSRDSLPAVSTPGSQFGSTDARILNGLNLTGEQRRELDQVSAAAVAKYRQLREQFNDDGDLGAYVRGQNETADRARSEFKRIMSKEQHTQYVDEWYKAMAPYFENSKKINGARKMLPISKKDQ